MSLKDFWPSLQNSLDCIKPEAENPSDAVFLAVHQQMTFVRTSFANQQKEARTERQLLNAFLRDDPSGRIIMPILGESGICLLYTSPSPRDKRQSRMPSSA